MLTQLGQAVNQALAQPHCAQIQIGNHGSILIFSADRRYVANLGELVSADDLQRLRIQLQPNGAANAPADAMPINRLTWHVALQLQRANGSDLPISTGLLRLVSWPDLSELPPEIVPSVARICALLWCKPTAAHLVARILDGSSEETATLLRLLLAFGHAQLLAPAVGEPAYSEAGNLHHTRPAASNSLLSKLWRRLSFRQ